MRGTPESHHLLPRYIGKVSCCALEHCEAQGCYDSIAWHLFKMLHECVDFNLLRQHFINSDSSVKLVGGWLGKSRASSGGVAPRSGKITSLRQSGGVRERQRFSLTTAAQVFSGGRSSAAVLTCRANVVDRLAIYAGRYIVVISRDAKQSARAQSLFPIPC